MGYVKLNYTIAALVLFGANAANAECNLENRVAFSCPIEGREKRLTICLKDGLPSPTIGYEMRDMSVEDHNGEVELYLERDILDVHYRNLGGRSQNIHQSVTFESGNLLYHVDMINMNAFEESQSYKGGVRVFEDEDEIASWRCKEGLAHTDTGEGLIIIRQYYRMGYEWCPGYGIFEIDHMRYQDCTGVEGEQGFDQVTGEAEPDIDPFVVPPPE